ncbi:B3/B4 domain-containing protein [Geminicoccus roseus]|uniref:B3/B4 domain-containing protein n=1 Tax=Geminicoccus roseus TaxID=404900 RepID=UPI000422404E|nr:phenylalanine--tRNA ligase beta subunit-related protein [Geminicoccus roseus]
MSFPFRYAAEIRPRFPKLCSGALLIDGVDGTAGPPRAIARFTGMADCRLAVASEGGLPEIRAWRRAFAAMGLKPTQHRCASEALLRRYRKEGALPARHPLIDLCNAASLGFAIPVAVFDTARIAGALTVRSADGGEAYETLAGGIERPEPGEIIFADEGGRAHARRWTSRQSGWSAIRASTTQALIVAEALHETGGEDVAALMATLARALAETWPGAVVTEVAPR